MPAMMAQAMSPTYQPARPMIPVARGGGRRGKIGPGAQIGMHVRPDLRAVLGQFHEARVRLAQKARVVLGVHGMNGIEAGIRRLGLRQPDRLERAGQRHGPIRVLDRRHDLSRDHELRGLVREDAFVEEQLHNSHR